MGLQDTFGTRVRETRQLRGLKQSELAEKVGMHQPDLCNLERGRHSPTLTTIERLANALDVSPEYLVSQALSQKPNP